MPEYDVIVVGGGGSGLAAAVSAAESGLRVLVVEKRPQLGGTTGIAVGSFTACGTRMQRARNLEDNPQDHDEDAGKFAAADVEARNNVELRRYFLTQAADTLHWLTGMGLAFHGPVAEPPNRVARMHNVVPNAKAYIAILHSRLLRLGGEVWCDAAVEGLLQAEGRVRGAIVRHRDESREVPATRGVVLATGDYAGSADVIARYKGDRFRTVEGINPHATGDGHLLAEEAGGLLVNMDITYGPELRFVPPAREPFAQLLPASGLLARVMGLALPWLPQRLLVQIVKGLLVTWQHPENALFDDGAILVNRSGERFCDERCWPEREIAVSRQSDKTAYIVLDERLRTRYGRWPHFISTAPEIAYAYVDDYLRLRPDVAVAGTLAEVAEARGLPLDSLADTIDQHNRDVSEPLSGEQWVLLGPLAAYFTTTEGGATIDHDFRVLDHDGQPIAGLYAVGQVGLGGQILWGHGLHIAWAMTSGRLVGKVLAGETSASTA